MCGRYFLFAPSSQIIEQFELDREQEITINRYTPHYNIAPGIWIPVVFMDETIRKAGPIFSLMKWQFVPFWFDQNKKPPWIINARAEGIAQKPFFRAAIKRRRCIVPASGFYEWEQNQKPGSPKIPYAFMGQNQELLGFAGIWESWTNAKDETIQNVAIITTAANQVVKTIHDRMPVILDPHQYSAWLRTDQSSAPLDLLKSDQGNGLIMQQASPEVNHAKNNYAELLLGQHDE